TPFSSAFPQAVEQAIQHVLKSPFSNKEVYLFTDAQKTAFNSTPAAWPPNSNTINGYMGYLSDSIDLPNVELTEITVSPVSAKPGEPVEARAKVRGHGSQSAGDVELDLEVGPTNRLHRKITLVPGRDEEVIFPTFQRSSNPVDSGVIRMQPDVLDTDNRLYYALPEGRPLRVLMSQGGGDDRVLNFIQVALRILAKMPVIPPLSAEFVKVQEIAAKAGEQPTDVILIANPGRVEEQGIQAMSAWMRDGGNLVLAMGAVVGEWVNQLLVPQWIPFELKRWEISRKEATHPRAFDFSNPWMDRFEEEDSSDWRSVSVWGGWEFASKGDSAVSSQNLITLDRGSPLLWQRNIGLGTLTLWMSSLDDSLNDVPHGGMYLALWGEYLRTLAEKKGLRAEFAAGSQVPVEVVRADDRPAEIRLIPPDGKPQILAVAGPKLTQTLYLSRTDQVGHYTIEFNPSRVERVTPSAFAVNMEAGEGDLTGHSLESLEKLLPFPVERFRPSESIASQITYSRYGFSLWPFVLLLLLAAMTLETWWSRPT
ncbi:MAG: hypothetical protein HUU16_21340, partial [Candidatus Omnitrophica bacterium]|nr:hypothetical protein [Candidatus Omnitrophota bacterium]